MDRLQTMVAFVTVVDCGGFAKAARKLALSPPAVTRAVADLEARLGLRLLTRTTRHVRVTDAGARYAEDCRRILAEIDEAETAASAAHAAVRGTLVLTAPVLFGQRHVMPIVVAYLQRFPEVEVECLFLDRTVNFVEEGVDVAIRIGELPDSSLQAIKVGQVRRVLVASPGYLHSRGTPARIDDLQAHTLIAATGITPGTDWRFTVHGRSVVQAVQARLRTTTNGAAIAAAEAGLGLTRVLGYQVSDALREGRLVAVLQAFEPGPLPIHVVHREGRHATQKVRGFVDLAVTTLRADAGLR